MSVSELSLTLEILSRTNPQSSDPRLRFVLNGLLPHCRELLRTQSSNATEQFRRIGESLIRIRGSTNAGIRLELLQDCCQHLYLSGSARDSITFAEHGVELATRSGRLLDLRRHLNLLAVAYAETGDRGRGVECTSRALALASRLNDRQGQYVSWSNLSSVFADSGMYSEAVACASRALDLIEPSDANAGDYRARTLTNTALALLSLGESIDAERCASRAVSLSVEPTSHRSAVVRIIRELNLVMALIANRKYSEARRRASYMQEISARFPSPRTNGTAWLCVGLAEVYLGNSERGLKLVEDAAAGFKDVMIPMYVDSLSLLTRLYTYLDRPEDALRVLGELVANVRATTSEPVIEQLHLLGDKENSVERSLKRNLREHERVQAELRAKLAEREVARSRQEMLERLAVAADIREDISGEHGYRVGRLSALLAKEIGWDHDACSALDIAARLHDIGKIGIPEKILFDEKTLKEAEKHFIASHTQVGAEILSKSEIPQVRIAEEIARCHHEWWNGTGYPRGLEGASIPKSARIVALADVFDAMTHGRPYAQAVPIDQVLDEISRLRGRQFDPELTDHFLVLVRRLAAEKVDLDTYLGKAARNSPFLKARARIKEMLAQGRDSTDFSSQSPPPGTPLN